MAETALAESIESPTKAQKQYPNTVHQPKKYLGNTEIPAKVVRKVVNMKSRGSELKDISAATGLTTRRVRSIIQKYSEVFVKINETQDFTAVKGKILDAAEHVVLEKCVEQAKLDKAPLKDCAYTYKVLHDANRLHKGLSTSNVSQQVSVQLKPLTELQQSLSKK